MMFCTLAHAHGCIFCLCHVRCDGGSVLRPGNSTADTECVMKQSTTKFSPQNPQIPPRGFKTQTVAYITSSPPPLTSVTSSITENQSVNESKSPSDPYPMTFIYTGKYELILLKHESLVVFC